ncbi:hypothetical protein HYX16_00405 [Candidatus Woesearchaeota archaeon]|nr:hypothetical protein [Candidatus Woesearchaeota archaeon]
MVLIIKRKGHKEKFDEKKIYGSVYAACASADYSENKCEKTAGEITKKVRNYLVNKKQISSSEIRKKIDAELKKRNKELAFFYEHHLPNLKRL